MENLVEEAAFLLKEKYNFIDFEYLKSLNGVGPNRNLLFQSGNSKFVMRCSLMEKEEIMRTIELTRLLARNGIPVNNIIPDKDGSDVVAYNSGNWILKDYIHGHIFRMSNVDELKMSASMLKRIHSISYKGGSDDSRSMHDPYYWLSDMEKEFALIINEFGERKEILEIRRILDDIKKEITLEDYLGLPKTIVHGDYHGRNILFSEDRVTGVLDLDTIGISARVIDFSEAIFLLGRFSYGSYEFNFEMIKKFSSVYESSFPLTNSEYELASYILKLRMIPRSRYLRMIKSISYENAIKQLRWSVETSNIIDKMFERYTHLYFIPQEVSS